MIQLINKSFSEVQFKEIIASAKAQGDCIRKLGFDYNCGSLWKLIKSNIDKLSISTDHFDSSYFRKERRGLSKDLNKDALELEINKKFTLKQLALIFNCSPSNIKYWIKKFDLKLSRGARGKLPKDFIRQRKCNKCGETDPNKFYGNKTTCCGKCHNKYNLTKGKEKKLFARMHLGGKCIICEFDKYLSALDIHHLNPKIKDTAFKSMRGWTYERILAEIKHCVLLCRNCHAAFHSGELVSEKLVDNISSENSV